MEKISVSVGIYNEEARIERFLNSFNCFDEIIVIDKSSTDNTVEILKKYNVKLVTIPYSDRGDISKFAVEAARNNWILMVTASDIIHPDLVKSLHKLINKENFPSELVYVPYMIHCHGINNIHSVFDNNYRPCLARKNIITFNDKVHEEISFHTTKIYYLSKNREVAIHHLTHQSMDSSFERAIRYTKEELKKNYSLSKNLVLIVKTIVLGIKKRFWMIGWDGLAMLFLLMNYYIMSFLRTWEQKRGINVKLYYKDLESKYK